MYVCMYVYTDIYNNNNMYALGAVFAAGRNNITRNAAGCYMASQICGGVFASFIYSSVTSGSAFDLGPYGMYY